MRMKMKPHNFLPLLIAAAVLSLVISAHAQEEPDLLSMECVATNTGDGREDSMNLNAARGFCDIVAQNAAYKHGVLRPHNERQDDPAQCTDNMDEVYLCYGVGKRGECFPPECV